LPDPREASRRTPSADEQAVRAADEAFVREYNNGDSKALAAMLTEDAEVVEADGDRDQGRDLIARGFADTLAADKGAKKDRIQGRGDSVPEHRRRKGGGPLPRHTARGRPGVAALHGALRQARRALRPPTTPHGISPSAPSDGGRSRAT